MNLIPLHDKVLVRRIKEDNVSRGGIVIPDAHAEKPNRGTVLAVGPGKYINGELRTPVVETNDIVLFGKTAGTPIKVDDEELTMLLEDEIYAKIVE